MDTLFGRKVSDQKKLKETQEQIAKTEKSIELGDLYGIKKGNLHRNLIRYREQENDLKRTLAFKCFEQLLEEERDIKTAVLREKVNDLENEVRLLKNKLKNEAAEKVTRVQKAKEELNEKMKTEMALTNL